MKLNIITKRKIIFHKKESEYYILYDDLQDKGIHKLYSLLSNPNDRNFRPFRDFFDENVIKKEYRDMYYIFTKMINNTQIHDKPENGYLYGQKIGKYWYIINKL